ncbi:hypothetical protein DFH11DRAFT_1810858 [Phellopilus nigrolimitatus]|nr:hypothetical protein DFH11DRAFT_1810858 [Phellopilus nigrolimitatus]
MAYLARRPDTHTIRLLMLPAVIMSAIHSCFGYMWTGHGMNVFNWGEGEHEYSALSSPASAAGLCCLVCIGKALDYALAKEGRFKVGEVRPGADRTPAISKKDYDPADPARPADADVTAAGAARPGARVLPRGVLDALELLFAFRGVGWDFGADVHIPPERKPLARRPFVAATLNSFAYNFAALDLLEASIKLVPGVGSPRGGSIFLPALPPLQRYALSTAVHVASGCALLAGFQMVYDLAALAGVALLGHAPASWPPVLDAPFRAASLHEFWGERWHQLLRHTFVVFGGAPGAALAGAPGMALGAFLASGVYHELSSVAMGRGVDARVVAFFAAQGAFVILERVWRRVTGRRVGGWPGRVWLYFDIMVLGQPMIDAWHMKGLGGGRMIPPVISPTRQLLFPLLSRLTGYELNTYQP